MTNHKSYSIEDDLKKIPFIEVILPYIENFTNEYELSSSVKNKLRTKLLEELATTAEVTLQSELYNFIDSGYTDFDEFIGKMISSLATDYPVLDKLLKIKVHNFSNHINKIIDRFREDNKEIESIFNLRGIKIVDIDVSLGDGHNGEGTALVHLSDGTKLIYKPRSVSITNSYNSFINWVNCKLKTDLKTFKIFDCKKYGWIEFINYEKVNSDKDLEEYYHKAGILLAVTLLLGSKDYHHENVISSGKNPVLIDHETIIQPFFSDDSLRTWDIQYKIPPFSVLESSLIINPNTNVPLDIVGYGVKGNIELTELSTKVININTINSKRTSRFTTRRIVDKNIPKYDGKYIFVNDYKEYFINGFSSAYDLFLNSKEELMSDNSPLKIFENDEIRYVWRPTFVYFKILKYMRSAHFMSSFDKYYTKLYELLSKAFKKDGMEKYKFILDFEMRQMLSGDIPILNLKSKYDFLMGNKEIKIFKYNSIENIYHRVDLLSFRHKEEQLKYISRWLNIQKI